MERNHKFQFNGQTILDTQDQLKKAFYAERRGNTLQSKYHFQNVISKLNSMMLSAQNDELIEHLNAHVKEYAAHVESLDKQFERNMNAAELLEKFTIENGDTGISYDRLFHKYFDDKLSEVLVEEPELYTTEHLKNTIGFLEFAKMNCPSLSFISIKTQEHKTRNSNQRYAFHHMQKNLSKHSITLEVDLVKDEQLEQRIVLGTGYMIRIQGGLSIFNPVVSGFDLGVNDCEYRQCAKSRVTIWKCPRVGFNRTN